MTDVSRRLRGLLLCAPAMLAAVPLHAEHSDQTPRDPVLTDVIVVTAARDAATATDTVEPPATIALPPDAAAIAARTAGGALVGNGALSGQLSYRGLAGERVVGRLNGQRFASGGPNAMDPPLHYAPAVLLERIEIARGVAPVSQGPGLAGAVNAVLLQPAFGSGSGQLPAGRKAMTTKSPAAPLGALRSNATSMAQWRASEPGRVSFTSNTAAARPTRVATRRSRSISCTSTPISCRAAFAARSHATSRSTCGWDMLRYAT